MALKEAHLALEKDEVPIGAVVVFNGKVIGKGHNMCRTLQDSSAHAEMIAMSSAMEQMGKYLEECTVYVTLEPCPMCAYAMNLAHLSKLVFACKDPKKGFSAFSPTLLHPKTKITQGILESECRELLQDFFKKKR